MGLAQNQLNNASIQRQDAGVVRQQVVVTDPTVDWNADGNPDGATIYFSTDPERLERLERRVEEAQRLESRTRHDLEMLREQFEMLVERQRGIWAQRRGAGEPAGARRWPGPARTRIRLACTNRRLGFGA